MNILLSIVPVTIIQSSPMHCGAGIPPLASGISPTLRGQRNLKKIGIPPTGLVYLCGQEDIRWPDGYPLFPIFLFF